MLGKSADDVCAEILHRKLAGLPLHYSIREGKRTMGWKGLERNKLDYILTDLLPVELSELFSFRAFYDFLLSKEQHNIVLKLVQKYKTLIAEGDTIPFKNGWTTVPLKYNILKGTNSSRELSIVQPLSALNIFLFIECYQKSILDFFNKNRLFSIRYHKKNTNLYYKSKTNKSVRYFQNQSKKMDKKAIQQMGNFFNIAPFESINSFADSKMWRMCNFRYKYYAQIDYKSCFDSIYSHAYKWIIEYDVIDSKEANNSNLFIVLDRMMQNINGHSSNGLIVGPEFSRMVAEILLQQIDNEVSLSLTTEGLKNKENYTIFRYVDDIFIFADSQEVLISIINKFTVIGTKYLMRLNDLKFSKGETPCVSKKWLEKVRQLADVINGFFYQIKKADFDLLPEEKRFLLKSDFIQVDRIKDEIVALMKEFPNDRRTIVSFLLSTLFNNISKKKDGYILVGKENIQKAMLIIDIALFVYAFCPAFDQMRKIISMIVYFNEEIDFKQNDNAKYKLQTKLRLYSFIFQQGNVFDLCDWLPFLKEYNIRLNVATENIIIDKIRGADDPIMWANILLYSKYYEPFFIKIKSEIEIIIDAKISRIGNKKQMLYKEFWYLLVFHNCPYICSLLKNKMETIISDISHAVSADPEPSNISTKLVCDFLQKQTPYGSKPKESFFNWGNTRSIGEQITYRTYQRTIFKHYRGNKYSLYASIN